jgi:hypothetical protein
VRVEQRDEGAADRHTFRCTDAHPQLARRLLRAQRGQRGREKESDSNKRSLSL